MQQPYQYPELPRRSNRRNIVAVGCVLLCAFCCVGALAFLLVNGEVSLSFEDTNMTLRGNYKINNHSSADLFIETYKANINVRNMRDINEEDIFSYEAKFEDSSEGFFTRASFTVPSINSSQSTIIQTGTRLIRIQQQNDGNSDDEDVPKSTWKIFANPTFPISYNISNLDGSDVSFILEDANATDISVVNSSNVSIHLYDNFSSLTAINVETSEGTTEIDYDGSGLPALENLTVNNTLGDVVITLEGDLGAANQNITFTITGQDGDISIDLSKANIVGTASLNVETDNGNVTVLLPTDISLNGYAASESGVIRYEDSNESSRQQFNDPNAILSIEITSSSGDININ